MPYNTNAIFPKQKEDYNGSSALPLARVRKIIKLDEDIDACTPAAAFLITLAAEEFVRTFTAAAFQMTRVEKKPRKNIQYKDLANAVSKMDNFEFLSDVVPKTMTFAQAMEKKRMEGDGKKNKDAEEALPVEDVLKLGKKKKGQGVEESKLSISGLQKSDDEVDEEEEEEGSLPRETSRMKNMQIGSSSSNHASGSGTGSGRKKKTAHDNDGDMVMQ